MLHRRASQIGGLTLIPRLVLVQNLLVNPLEYRLKVGFPTAIRRCTVRKEGFVRAACLVVAADRQKKWVCYEHSCYLRRAPSTHRFLLVSSPSTAYAKPTF